MDRQSARVVELDVRSHLRMKLEPFQIIMDTVKSLDIDDIFVLHATFKPTPLFGVLKMKGFAGRAEQVGREHWVSTFVNKRNKQWLDERAWEAKNEDIAEAGEEKEEEDCPTAAPIDSPNTVRLDNRGLEPPKPMMRTLTALDRCRPGDEVVIHNDRVPMFLIEELHSLGYPYTVEEQPDGSAKVYIRKA